MFLPSSGSFYWPLSPDYDPVLEQQVPVEEKRVVLGPPSHFWFYEYSCPPSTSLFYDSLAQTNINLARAYWSNFHPNVLSCLVLTCFVLFCFVLSCLVLSCLFLCHHLLSCLVLSCCLLFCIFLSFLVLSCFFHYIMLCVLIRYQPDSQMHYKKCSSHT